MRRVASIVAVLVLACACAPGVARAAARTIGPGAEVFTSQGQCTLNFVFRGRDGTRYVGTAGHCVKGTGERPADQDGVEFGTVVFSTFAGVGGDDFALIKIDAGRAVNPATPSWNGPTRVASDATFGDRILLDGYGLGFGETARTRARAGVLEALNDRTYTAEAPAIFGDSGGPVLLSDGSALGIVSGINIPTTYTLTGPTIGRILTILAAHDLPVELATAA